MENESTVEELIKSLTSQYGDDIDYDVIAGKLQVLTAENKELREEVKAAEILHAKDFAHNLRQAKKIAAKNDRINKTDGNLAKMDRAIVREVGKSQALLTALETYADEDNWDKVLHSTNSKHFKCLRKSGYELAQQAIETARTK